MSIKKFNPPNPQGNRSKVICPTKKTRSMEKLLYELGSELEERLTRNLTPDDKAELLRLLKKTLSRKEN